MSTFFDVQMLLTMRHFCSRTCMWCMCFAEKKRCTVFSVFLWCTMTRQSSGWHAATPHTSVMCTSYTM